MRCKKCDADQMPDSVFCDQCGEPLSPLEKSSVPAVERIHSNHQPHSLKPPRGIIIAAGYFFLWPFLLLHHHHPGSIVSAIIHVSIGISLLFLKRFGRIAAKIFCCLDVLSILLGIAGVFVAIISSLTLAHIGWTWRSMIAILAVAAIGIFAVLPIAILRYLDKPEIEALFQ